MLFAGLGRKAKSFANATTSYGHLLWRRRGARRIWDTGEVYVYERWA